MQATKSVCVFLDPPSRRLERDRIFEVGSTSTGERLLDVYAYLRDALNERGIPVHTLDLFLRGEEPARDLNVLVSLGGWTRYRRLARRDDFVLSAFFAAECPIVEPRMFRELHTIGKSFRRVFSVSDPESLGPFLSGPVDVRPFRYPYPSRPLDTEVWSRRGRGFLTMINANKLPRLDVDELYRARVRALEHFERDGEIDLYGFGWAGPSMRVGTTRVPGTLRLAAYRTRRLWERLRPDPSLAAPRRAYRGAVASKIDTLSRYTFALCFENQALSGWVTEKIFDCLHAGTIPVYLGAPDIEDWVHDDCFVDVRRFLGFDDLREYLHSLRDADIAAYRAAGRTYLESDAFDPFRKETFASLVMAAVEEDTGIGALGGTSNELLVR